MHPKNGRSSNSRCSNTNKEKILLLILFLKYVQNIHQCLGTLLIIVHYLLYQQSERGTCLNLQQCRPDCRVFPGLCRVHGF